ncbi:peptidase [Nocardia shimofusensis]|uniref:peptidase n=1 Tax=Nocardia shimofusensis TaxID=228596 RepID=UPI0012EDB9E1|nr:peptidase [Nocardia shimofusensis]
MGTIRSVLDDQPYSCTAEIDAEGDADNPTTLGWTSMAAWEPRSADYGSTRRFGDVTVWTVADSDMPGARIDPDARTRSCSTTSRFPSGAAIYLDIEVSAGSEPCSTLDALVPAMLDRWRTEPPRGSSPDVRSTVLPGADPCAVRQRLPGTETEGQLQTNVCSFRYRGEFVLVAFEYRMRDTVTAAHTEVHIAGRSVHRSNLHAETDPYRTYVAVVGPELSPAEPTDIFGPDVPVLVVDAESDEVAAEVMEQALALLS